jgi:hypothetical protein
LTGGECKAILVKRERFELALADAAPTKASFLRYVAYELKLDEVIRHRKGAAKRRTRGVGDFFCVRHAYALYERALSRWDDLDLWLEYVALASKNGAPKMVGRLFARATAAHATEPRLWVRAAQWEYADQGNARGARRLLQRGLRFNGKDARLWNQYLSFELRYLDQLRKRRDTLQVRAMTGDEAFFRGEIPAAVARAGLGAVDDVAGTRALFLATCGAFEDVDAVLAAVRGPAAAADDDDDAAPPRKRKRTRRELRATLVLCRTARAAALAAAGGRDAAADRAAKRAFDTCPDSERAAAAFALTAAGAPPRAAPLAAAAAHARNVRARISA